MVGGHEPGRGAAQHALAVEDAAVRQHLCEAQVVASGRHGAGAAGVVSRLLGYLDQLDRRARQRILVEGLSHASDLGLRYPEGCAAHAEGLEQALAHEVAQALARGGFHDPPKEVGREAVLPRCSGLMDQRNLGKPLDLLGAGQVADVEVDDAGLVEPGLSQRVLDGCVLRQLSVGEAGGVAQEILNRHGALGRDLAAGGRYLHVLERRKPFGDRVGELECAVFDQDHRGDRGHGLGHRVDPEDRVEPHGIGALGIAHALRAGVDELALAGDHHDGARDFLLLDLLLEGVGEAAQSRRRHAAGLGRRGRERRCRERCRRRRRHLLRAG